MKKKKTKTVMRPFVEMQPGDVIAYEGRPRVLILRVNEDAVIDRFGRHLKGHWCRTLDTESREGYVFFGPDGVGPVEVRRRPCRS